jgi:hypothetical protein
LGGEGEGTSSQEAAVGGGAVWQRLLLLLESERSVTTDVGPGPLGPNASEEELGQPEGPRPWRWRFLLNMSSGL